MRACWKTSHSPVLHCPLKNRPSARMSQHSPGCENCISMRMWPGTFRAGISARSPGRASAAGTLRSSWSRVFTSLSWFLMENVYTKLNNISNLVSHELCVPGQSIPAHACNKNEYNGVRDYECCDSMKRSMGISLLMIGDEFLKVYTFENPQ